MSLEENRTSGNPAPSPAGIRALASPTPAIDLWACSVEPVAAAVDMFERHLSKAELARAARFGNPRLRDRYVMGRGGLRTILAGKLGTDPAAVEIVRGIRGRPQLAGTPVLDFNVSHTGGIAIVGIVRKGRIGVDIERLDRSINVAGIARKFMTANEREELPRQDADAVRQRLLTLWTCKEAMSKATGDALSAPFASIDIDLRAGRKVRAGVGDYDPSLWTLYPVSVTASFVATAALWIPVALR